MLEAAHQLTTLPLFFSDQSVRSILLRYRNLPSWEAPFDPPKLAAILPLQGHAATNRSIASMGLFDDINTRISENLQRHGHYLTDPHAAEEEKIAETVDILTQFVRPERRETVRAQIIEILRREADLSDDT